MATESIVVFSLAVLVILIVALYANSHRAEDSEHKK